MLRRILSRREEEDQVRRANRLPPGQAVTQKFPILHYGPVPKVDLATWDFKIFGAVVEERTWDWEAFNKLPRRRATLDVHCVTRWSKFDTLWEGVSLGQLVAEGLIRPKPEVRYILQHCEHGYTANVPLALALQDNFLLATHYDGRPLEPEHGYPLRAVVGSFPDRSETMNAYFWKGGKWLRALEFRADDAPGFWERAGYHNEGDPWKEQRVAGINWFNRL